MSILANKDTRLVVQGITGREGTFHTQQMIDYGTPVVAGVTPGKGGTDHLGVPVFNTLEEAVRETGANASISFVPPAGGADAILEAIGARIALIVAITENIPVLDMMRVYDVLKESELAPDRSQLPRPDHSRRSQGGDHSRLYLQTGQRRHGLSLGHAYIRSHQFAD